MRKTIVHNLALLVIGVGSYLTGSLHQSQQFYGEWGEAINAWQIQQETPQITGQEFFDAINSYRASVGLDPLTIDKTLCNGISIRWNQLNKQRDESHPDFDEWIKRYKNSPYIRYGEVYATGQTAQDLIDVLLTSPSHKLALEDEEAGPACTYARDDLGLLLTGFKD